MFGRIPIRVTRCVLAISNLIKKKLLLKLYNLIPPSPIKFKKYYFYNMGHPTSKNSLLFIHPLKYDTSKLHNVTWLTLCFCFFSCGGSRRSSKLKLVRYIDVREMYIGPACFGTY